MRRILFSLAFALLAGEGAAAACSCVSFDGGVADRVAQSDAAFDGVIERIDLVADPDFLMAQEVRFSVRRVWKGATTAAIVVRTGRGGGDCGLSVAVGQRWLIFADESTGRLYTGICSGSFVLTDPAQADPLGPPIWTAPPVDMTAPADLAVAPDLSAPPVVSGGGCEVAVDPRGRVGALLVACALALVVLFSRERRRG